MAVATNTHPRPWWDEPPEMIATVLEILDKQAKEAKRNGKS